MATVVERDAVRTLREVEERLDPERARAWALARLGELFRSGSAPDPLPSGFHEGKAILSSIAGPVDAFGRRLASLYMPWLGKSFDAESRDGINILTKGALPPLKVMFSSYRPIERDDGRVEAFRFTTRVAPGAVDPDVEVLKIDYDSSENPGLIRRILDELVQVDDGLYLGKVLLRGRTGFRPIGFFSLQRPS